MADEYVDVDSIFSWTEAVHYRDGPSLMDLYSVTLLIDLPRKNLKKGRKFEHMLVDYDYQKIKIYYKNDKSCCVWFNEIGNIGRRKYFSEYWDDYHEHQYTRLNDRISKNLTCGREQCKSSDTESIILTTRE